MIVNTLVWAALASSAFATPIFSKRVVHEKREILASIKGSRVHEDAIIPIRIGLKQNNLEHGYNAVMDVSDPDSANYGKHWTIDEVRKYFAPSDDAVAAVKTWLLESGVPSEIIGESEDRAWIGINVPARQAEELLSAEYHEYTSHVGDNHVRLGCDEYSLPNHISDLVDYVKPGISLSPPIKKRAIQKRTTASFNLDVALQHSNRPQWRPPYKGPWSPPPGTDKVPKDLRKCGTNITIACIRALYDIPVGTLNTKANDLGVAEFSPQAYSQEDLNLFFAKDVPKVPAGTHPILYSIDGGKAPVAENAAGLEADVDFDMTIGLVYPQQTALYQVGEVSFANYTNKQIDAEITFLTPLFDAIDGSFCTAADKKNSLQCGTVPVPRVLSVSYGSTEVYNTQAAVVRTCNEIMKLSLQGSTIIFSSSDYGVSSLPTNTYNGCIDPPTYKFGKSGTVFAPDYPADCPYILSVGATELLGNQTIYDPERVMFIPGLTLKSGAEFSSGGGFSNYFSRPSYQASAVESYFSKYDPGYKTYVYNGNDIFSGKSNIGANGGLYNRAGRGYPDVSANGVNFTIFFEGEEGNVVGTSLSAPLWASIITLINNERTKAGSSPVGFVQPVLYKNPQAFHDITIGDNPGCGTNGFSAVPGWDPVTGLGTPNYPALLKVFMANSGSYTSS